LAGKLSLTPNLIEDGYAREYFSDCSRCTFIARPDWLSSEVSKTVNEIDNGFRHCRRVLTENARSDYMDFQGEDG